MAKKSPLDNSLRHHKIADNIYLIVAGYCPETGSMDSKDGNAYVHACKTPCFTTATACLSGPYEQGQFGIERENDLYLNMVDADNPNLFNFRQFKLFLEFAEKNKHRNLIIHCNQGRSRSPTLGLLLLAKRGIITNKSFRQASAEFREKIYPRYCPGIGIKTFMEQTWS